MASYKDILKEKDNQNWLKGSIALRITKAGLRGLVDGDCHRVQQKIHSSVLLARNLAVGTTCSLCLTEHVLQCPTKGLCSHPRSCKYHNSAFKIHRPCPSKICDDFRDEICAVHRYRGPSWKNTKANQWCTNHWQVAKCFMPPDGYHDVTSYDETDFNGIISVMINCTEFQQRMSFPIGNQPNALTEARVIGRNIRHSPDLKVTDTDLADYFATLNRLLTDSTFLLDKGTLPITTEEVRELLEEARATVVAGLESGKRQLMETAETRKIDIEGVVLQVKTAMEAGTRQLEETAETGKKNIEGVVSQGKRLLEVATKTGNSELEGVVTQGRLHLEHATNTGNSELEGVVSQGKRLLEVATKTGKSELEGVVTQGKRQLEDAMTTARVFYERRKLEIEDADLRQRLVKYYQKQLNSAPISPLLSNKDERLDKFYVPRKLRRKTIEDLKTINNKTVLLFPLTNRFSVKMRDWPTLFS
ncbi:uncharacterized protein LOC128233597 isoform X2 [Mya arenaria]|uniref:uncharacterized protein LOC128233597 isoform X2 n=1 Tax=Mya arenaria TaxID=6604 RepID=UPI0022E35258|nr:uncharacterized protein LOC128233597 isoform X2 [Mya arenaria]